MPQFVLKKPSSDEILDLAQLTYEARQASALSDDSRKIESVLGEVTEVCEDDANKIILAYDDERIVGWTQVYTGFPLMMFIGRWYPVVRVGIDPEPVTTGLIEKCKDLLRTSDHTRLEIELDEITMATESEMKIYAGWYSGCGFTLAAREASMTAMVEATEPVPPPDGYSIQNLVDISNADLEGPFYDTFDNGQDELYLSLDREQRGVTFRYFFDRTRPMIEEASLAIYFNGQIVGFTVARKKHGVADIGPVGVVPEHRGKGLGKTLMSYSLDALHKMGLSLVGLDASYSNTRARNLYEKYGFRVQSLKAFLVWSK